GKEGGERRETAASSDAHFDFSRKLRQLRGFSSDDSGYHTSLQADFILLPGEKIEHGVLDAIGPLDAHAGVEEVMWLAAGVGVGDLFSKHVDVGGRKLEFVVGGEALADLMRMVQVGGETRRSAGLPFVMRRERNSLSLPPHEVSPSLPNHTVLT
ncbi:MAG: hypothetical protein SGPRY_003065, partial [Prymnesium sp.]